MPQTEQQVADISRRPRTHRRRTSFGFIDRLLHLSDVVDYAVRFLKALHNALGAMLFTVTRVIPLVGVLIEGLGYLASPLTLLPRNREKRVNKLELGVKVVAGAIMVACAVVGFVFPPLGLTMVIAGLGASIGVGLYKTHRASAKLSQAQQGAEHVVSEHEVNNLADSERVQHRAINKYSRKVKKRAINTALVAVNAALLVVCVAVPPVAIFAIGLLLAVNVSYFIYDMGKKLKNTYDKSSQQGASDSLVEQKGQQQQGIDDGCDSEVILPSPLASMVFQDNEDSIISHRELSTPAVDADADDGVMERPSEFVSVGHDTKVSATLADNHLDETTTAGSEFKGSENRRSSCRESYFLHEMEVSAEEIAERHHQTYNDMHPHDAGVIIDEEGSLNTTLQCPTGRESDPVTDSVVLQQEQRVIASLVADEILTGGHHEGVSVQQQKQSEAHRQVTPPHPHDEGQVGTHEVENTSEVKHVQQQRAIHSFLEDETEILVHHGHPDEVKTEHLHGHKKGRQRPQQQDVAEEDTDDGGEAASVGEETREGEGGAELYS